MRSQYQRVRISFGGGFTPIVKSLLWINGLVFLFLLLVGNQVYPPLGLPYADLLVSLLGLSPHAVLNNWALWQPFSYMFIHQAFFHLLFNMLALWWFGSDLEATWGSKTFFRYYLYTGLGAAITSIVFNVPTIGASGAVYGLLLAYGLLFPNRVLYLYFVLPVKAKYCVLAFALLELIALRTSSASNVNHFAHLGGMAFGFVWLAFSGKYFRAMDFWKNLRKRRMRRKLRLIKRKKSKDDQDQGPYGSYSNRTLH